MYSIFDNPTYGLPVVPLIPKSPSVPKGSSNLHFDCIFQSVQPKFAKFGSRHLILILEEDPKDTFSNFHLESF